MFCDLERSSVRHSNFRLDSSRLGSLLWRRIRLWNQRRYTLLDFVSRVDSESVQVLGDSFDTLSFTVKFDKLKPPSNNVLLFIDNINRTPK